MFGDSNKCSNVSTFVQVLEGGKSECFLNGSFMDDKRDRKIWGGSACCKAVVR